jgi:hypothetical protein
VGAFARRALDQRTGTDSGFLDGTIKSLRTVPPAVVQARLDEVLTACLRSSHPQLGAFLLAELKAPVPRLLVERWGRTLGTRELVGDGLWCVACLDSEDLPDKRRAQLAAAVREFAKTLPREKFEAWHDEVARLAGPAKRDLWTEVFQPEASRPRMSLWRDKDGGRR